MSNINDYLKWRGDISLKHDELNEIDELILARYSYFPFFKIEMELEETISDISKKMSKFKDDEYNYLGDREMNELIGKSARFKNLKVTDYRESNDQDEEKQFSAITIKLNNELKYISFLGTDKSIIGWKEDFNLSFTQDIPAQIEALKYANNMMKKYPNSKFIFGGHSKGGNIAVYAAINSSLENKARIIKVLNYDGPGFPEEIIESDKFNQIKEKIHTYLPQESIIGRIMDQGGKVTVVTSTEKNIYQHDIYSWQLIAKKFNKRNKPNQKSEIVYKSLRKFLRETEAENRKKAIDLIFKIFIDSEFETFAEIGENKAENIMKIIGQVRELKKEDKDLIVKMLSDLAKAYISTRTKDIKKRRKNRRILNVNSKWSISKIRKKKLI